jgi:hypothetical protein
MPPWLALLLLASGALGPLAGLWYGRHHRREARLWRKEADDLARFLRAAAARGGDEKPAGAVPGGGSENWVG